MSVLSKSSDDDKQSKMNCSSCSSLGSHATMVGEPFFILRKCMPFVMLQPDFGVVGVVQRMSAKDEHIQDRQWRGLEESIQYVSYQTTMSIRRKFYRFDH